MSIYTPIFFSERLHEYQQIMAKKDPDFEKKLKEKELDNDYKNNMEKGCRIFAKELEKINEKIYSVGYKSSLNYHIPNAKNHTYFYTGCQELKNFISHFNSKHNNQIIINNDKFVIKILVNE